MYKKQIMPFNILKMSSNITYKDNKLKSTVSLLRLFRTAVSNSRITLILLMIMITKYKTAILWGSVILRMLEVAGSISSMSDTLIWSELIFFWRWCIQLRFNTKGMYNKVIFGAICVVYELYWYLFYSISAICA